MDNFIAKIPKSCKIKFTILSLSLFDDSLTFRRLAMFNSIDDGERIRLAGF